MKRIDHHSFFCIIFNGYNAQANIIPIIAKIMPKCKKRLEEVNQPKPGKNWSMKLITTNTNPAMGNSPLRCAKYSDR